MHLLIIKGEDNGAIASTNIVPRIKRPKKRVALGKSGPWCAIGLASLEKALDDVGSEVNVEVYFQPFELNAHIDHGINRR